MLYVLYSGALVTSAIVERKPNQNMNYYKIDFSYYVGNKSYDVLMVAATANPIVAAAVEGWFNENVTYNQELPLHIIINACTESFFESQPKSSRIFL